MEYTFRLHPASASRVPAGRYPPTVLLSTRGEPRAQESGNARRRRGHDGARPAIRLQPPLSLARFAAGNERSRTGGGRRPAGAKQETSPFRFPPSATQAGTSQGRRPVWAKQAISAPITPTRQTRAPTCTRFTNACPLSVDIARGRPYLLINVDIDITYKPVWPHGHVLA